MIYQVSYTYIPPTIDLSAPYKLTPAPWPMFDGIYRLDPCRVQFAIVLDGKVIDTYRRR